MSEISSYKHVKELLKKLSTGHIVWATHRIVHNYLSVDDVIYGEVPRETIPRYKTLEHFTERITRHPFSKEASSLNLAESKLDPTYVSSEYDHVKRDLLYPDDKYRQTDGTRRLFREKLLLRGGLGLMVVGWRTLKEGYRISGRSGCWSGEYWCEPEPTSFVNTRSTTVLCCVVVGWDRNIRNGKPTVYDIHPDDIICYSELTDLTPP